MKKKIIALSGRANSGKTTTLNIAYEKLCSLKSAVVLWHEPIGRGLDFIAVLRLGKTRVGVVSQGDEGDALEGNLRRLANESCALILCATRSYGFTVDAVEDMHPPYELEFIRKVIAVEETGGQSNRLQAARIVNTVCLHLGL